MRRKQPLLLLCLSLFVVSTAAADLSDAQIRAVLIERSIASYTGKCACPYSTKSNGDRCGKSSAYSRPGGDRPKCYPSDVSDEEVERHRRERT